MLRTSPETEKLGRKKKITGGGWVQRKNDLKSWVRLHLPHSYILQRVKLLAQGRVCLQGGGIYSLLKGDPPTGVRHGYFPAWSGRPEMRHRGTNRTLKTPIEAHVVWNAMLSCEAEQCSQRTAESGLCKREFGETQDLLKTLGVGREDTPLGGRERILLTTTHPLGVHLLVRVSAWPNLSGSITYILV